MEIHSDLQALCIRISVWLNTHCSVEIVNGLGRLILEDAVAVPERDDMHLLGECVHEPKND